MGDKSPEYLPYEEFHACLKRRLPRLNPGNRDDMQFLSAAAVLRNCIAEEHRLAVLEDISAGLAVLHGNEHPDAERMRKLLETLRRGVYFTGYPSEESASKTPPLPRGGVINGDCTQSM